MNIGLRLNRSVMMCASAITLLVAPRSFSAHTQQGATAPAPRPGLPEPHPAQATTASQQGQWRADVPTPRTDSNSMLAHRQLLEKRTQGKIDLYFLGNSITRRWGATDYPEFLANWRANFHGWSGGHF